MMMARRLANGCCVSWLLSGALLLAGCGSGDAKPPTASIDASTVEATPASLSTTVATPPAQPQPAPKAVDPVVILHTSLGDIKVQLLAEKAPETVDNFLRNYANRGFYDNTIVHHVEAGSMVICGGYLPDLQPREVRASIRNESENGLSNQRGTVAMARDPEFADTANSQFFFNVSDNTGLDFAAPPAGDTAGGQEGYCVFGKVIEGMEIVDRIAALPVAPQGDFEKVPSETVVIHSVEQLR